MISTRIGVVLIACGACSANVWADEIATDRPDFVESADVVGKGRFQFETSIAYERDKRAGTSTRIRTTPTLFRLGVSDSLELRLETEGRVRAKSMIGTVSESANGTADAALGVKWHFRDGDASGAPAMALLVHGDLDSGSEAFRGQGVRPSIRLVAEWELPGGMSAGLMPGAFQERNDEGRRYTGFILAGVVGQSLTDSWRVFGEISVQQAARKRDGGNFVTLDLGTAYLLASNWQVDFAVSRGITKPAPDWSWTFGLSARF